MPISASTCAVCSPSLGAGMRMSAGVSENSHGGICSLTGRHNDFIRGEYVDTQYMTILEDEWPEARARWFAERGA